MEDWKLFTPGALRVALRAHPLSVLVVLASTLLGACLGAAAYYQGWLG